MCKSEETSFERTAQCISTIITFICLGIFTTVIIITVIGINQEWITLQQEPENNTTSINLPSLKRVLNQGCTSLEAGVVKLTQQVNGDEVFSTYEHTIRVVGNCEYDVIGGNGEVRTKLYLSNTEQTHSVKKQEFPKSTNPKICIETSVNEHNCTYSQQVVNTNECLFSYASPYGLECVGFENDKLKLRDMKVNFEWMSFCTPTYTMDNFCYYTVAIEIDPNSGVYEVEHELAPLVEVQYEDNRGELEVGSVFSLLTGDIHYIGNDGYNFQENYFLEEDGGCCRLKQQFLDTDRLIRERFSDFSVMCSLCNTEHPSFKFNFSPIECLSAFDAGDEVCNRVVSGQNIIPNETPVTYKFRIVDVVHIDIAASLNTRVFPEQANCDCNEDFHVCNVRFNASSATARKNILFICEFNNTDTNGTVSTQTEYIVHDSVVSPGYQSFIVNFRCDVLAVCSGVDCIQAELNMLNRTRNTYNFETSRNINNTNCIYTNGTSLQCYDKICQNNLTGTECCMVNDYNKSDIINCEFTRDPILEMIVHFIESYIPWTMFILFIFGLVIGMFACTYSLCCRKNSKLENHWINSIFCWLCVLACPRFCLGDEYEENEGYQRLNEPVIGDIELVDGKPYYNSRELRYNTETGEYIYGDSGEVAIRNNNLVLSREDSGLEMEKIEITYPEDVPF